MTEENDTRVGTRTDSPLPATTAGEVAPTSTADAVGGFYYDVCGKCGHRRDHHEMGLSENLIVSGRCKSCDCALFISEAFLKRRA